MSRLQISALVAELAALDTDVPDADRVDELTALERLKSACAARQARLTDAFAASQRATLVKAGSDGRDARRSVRHQVALARRDSPHKGGRHVGLAHALVLEMPGVLRALERGDTSEWRATIITRETAHLAPELRAQIDAAIADQLHGWGDARTEREVRAWAQRLDPYGAADRARKAEGDRRVSIRPAPDCMSYPTALLPMKQGVAVYGELRRRAMSAAVDPDEHRSRGQVMVDELVNRVLTPAQGEPVQPAIEVHLVMTDRVGTVLPVRSASLAHVLGYGPVPAPVATAGWATLVQDGTIVTTTPTGHRHISRAPRRPAPCPGPGRRRIGAPGWSVSTCNGRPAPAETRYAKMAA